MLTRCAATLPQARAFLIIDGLDEIRRCTIFLNNKSKSDRPSYSANFFWTDEILIRGSAIDFENGTAGVA